MGAFSIWHLAILAVLVLLIFGRGKIPELMGDVAKGIKNFKHGINDDSEPEVAVVDDEPKVIGEGKPASVSVAANEAAAKPAKKPAAKSKKKT